MSRDLQSDPARLVRMGREILMGVRLAHGGPPEGVMSDVDAKRFNIRSLPIRGVWTEAAAAAWDDGIYLLRLAEELQR